MEMKWNYLLLAGTFVFLSTFTACTNETDEQNLSDELKQVVVTVKDFIPEVDSRAFSLVNNSVEFSWEDGDTIGIFPNTGAQAYFPILSESAGTNTASFTGGGWALKSSSTYAAYYPFVGNFYISQKEIPICYEGQKQTGNASMAHLSTHDFMAASGSTPSSGKVNFHFAHLGAFAQLKITMPQGGTLTSVTLSADEAVFTAEGTIDLTATTPAIKSVKKSKTLKLDVENVTTTPESNVATLYMMLTPVDFTSRTLSAIVETSDGKSETITLTGKNFEAGKAYGVSGTMKDPNDGAVAGDGTYKDGVVSVDVAGNMKKLLGDDYLNITSLKVVGPINGDDVYYLRKMLGGSNFSEADWGKLTTLDLSEATIVEGGEWYYDGSTSTGDEYYTSNNEIGNYMFYGCANLQNITLPDNVTSIGYYAFVGTNKIYSMIIPDSVISIGNSVFAYHEGLESITIGDGVTSIGEDVFWQCYNLKDVTIGKSLKSIGENAFFGCHDITSVHITDLNAWIKIDFQSNPLSHGGMLYLNNEEVTKIVIPEDVTEIKEGTFTDWKTIKEIIIHDKITTIGDKAFYGCEALTSVAIGINVTSIGDYAFNDCEALISVTIGDNVTSIGAGAFCRCEALTSVTIPNNVTYLPYISFSGCNALTEVTIGNGITSIGEEAFYKCSINVLYCYATKPPSLYNPFYSGIKTGATLYVPARCGAAYKSSGWENYFKNIVEMD